MTTARRLLPFLRWFPLDAATVRADFLAGVTVSMLLLPQAMAYAQLAGLPPHYGLYTAFLPTIVAALFGWCSQLHTGPVAMTSLLTATVVAGVSQAAPESEAYIATAILLTLLAGLIRLAMGALRLAVLVNFLSHPVVVGFTNAGALIIASSQLAPLLGLPHGQQGLYLPSLLRLLGRVHECRPAALGFGLAALALILALRRWRPHWPGVLITLAVAILLSWLLGFESRLGGQVVGAIPCGLPAFRWPHGEWSAAPQLLLGAFAIMLVGFMEVVAICKTLSAKTKEPLDLNQELIGQGLAGVVGSLFQAYPVSGSFSRSALNLYAGARTGLSSVFAGLLVLLSLLFLTPLLYYLPRAVLGAVIVAAVIGLVDAGAMLRIWRTSRYDGVAAWTTFVAAIVLAPRVVDGILVGVGLSVAFHLYQLMRPHVAILAPHPDGSLRDARHHRLLTHTQILAIRFDGRLVFANASHFQESVLKALAEQPTTRVLLIVASGINTVDATGEEMLRHLVNDLTASGLRVAFAAVRWPVLDVFQRTGLQDLIGAANLFASPEAAYAELTRPPPVADGGGI
jgi:SulP family sulfate permease